MRQPSGSPQSASFLCLTISMPTCILMPMKRTAIFLKEEQIQKLQRLSDKTGAPVAELIRRAIDGYLKRGGKS
jgi:hypothetical protein